jgi:hypothetical protein
MIICGREGDSFLRAWVNIATTQHQVVHWLPNKICVAATLRGIRKYGQVSYCRLQIAQIHWSF